MVLFPSPWGKRHVGVVLSFFKAACTLSHLGAALDALQRGQVAGGGVSHVRKFCTGLLWEGSCSYLGKLPHPEAGVGRSAEDYGWGSLLG